MKKTVCYFGSYDSLYPRNKILISGLRQNNYTVCSCNNRDSGLLHYIKLIVIFLKLNRQFNTIIIGVLGYTDVPLAWLLAKIFKKKLIFDAFFSLHDTYINDRKIHPKISAFAFKFFLQDLICCHLADIVILDTKAHAEYFIKKYKLGMAKVKNIYIGADENFLNNKRTKRKKNNKFIVEFHGSFQRLQGVDFIVKAANLLKGEKNVQFKLIGDGLTKRHIQILIKRLNQKNIQLIPWQSVENLKKILEDADVCLGIFGKTNKANLVIPNKGFEAIAISKPLITLNSPAARELFEDKKTALLVDNSDPKNLAQAIMLLNNNKKLYNYISKSANNLFRKKLTAKILGRQLVNIIEKN